MIIIITIIIIFHDVLYLPCLSKVVLRKISKCEWKQGVEKNNNKKLHIRKL